MTKAMTGLRDDLIFQKVATYPYNFLILPNSPASGKIQIVPHGFAPVQPGVPPIVAGVSANQRSLPFKAFDPEEEVSSLLEPPMATKTRSQHGKKIPAIKQFLRVKGANGITRHKGQTTGESVDELTN
jgi:hypothetical protein